MVELRDNLGRVTIAALLAGALVLAGCGSSGGASTSTSGNKSSLDKGLVKAAESASEPKTIKIPSLPTTGPLTKEPHVTPPSGPAPTTVQTKELIAGKGAEVKPGGATVVADYVGILYKGGKEFAASWKHHKRKPFAFILGKNQLIPGWEKGVIGMKVGGRRELIVPAAVAYGAKGSPPTIPPNAALVYVVDLLECKAEQRGAVVVCVSGS